MKNSLLAIFMLFASSIAYASSEAHCDSDPAKYAHCAYADRAVTTSEYSTQVQYIMPDGSLTEPREWCIGEGSELSLKMTAPVGMYTMYVRMGTFNDQGNIEYRDYAAQTFVHNGQGPASPDIFGIYIGGEIEPVPCVSETQTEAVEDIVTIQD